MLDGAQASSPPASSAGQTLTPLRSPFHVAVYYPALSSCWAACQPRSPARLANPRFRPAAAGGRAGGRAPRTASQPAALLPSTVALLGGRPPGSAAATSIPLRYPFHFL